MRTSENHCFRELFKYITLLVNVHHLPIVVSYRDKHQKQRFFGSKHSKRCAKINYFKSVTIQRGFDMDYSDLNLPGNLGNIEYEPLSAYFKAASENDIELLPFPLEWMRLPELGPWITSEMMRQYHDRGNKGNKKLFGRAEFRPDFWQDNIWPWEQVKNFREAFKKKN